MRDIPPTLDRYTDESDNLEFGEIELRRLRWAATAGPVFAPYEVVCVHDREPMHSYPILNMAYGYVYTVYRKDENGTPHINNGRDLPDQPINTERTRRIEELPKWAREEIKAAREHIWKVNALLVKFGHPVIAPDSGIYPEGFRWDVDNYTGNAGGRQTRRWDTQTHQFVDGEYDPPFEAL